MDTAGSALQLAAHGGSRGNEKNEPDDGKAGDVSAGRSSDSGAMSSVQMAAELSC